MEWRTEWVATARWGPRLTRAAVAVQNGPSATRCLADYGCTVVKIEGMRGDEMRGLGKAPDNFNFVQEGFNRSKLSLTLDLCAADHPPPPT